MKLRLVELSSGERSVAVLHRERWYALRTLFAESADMAPCTSDVIEFLAGGECIRDRVEAALARADSAGANVADEGEAHVVLPFQPVSFRDFMLFERHVINAGRGYAKRFLPKLWPVLSLYEKILRKPHPKLRPKPLWYEHPIYYVGSHVNMFTEGDTIPWPGTCAALDYELELGVIVTKPLYNATPEEALDAVGGVVVLNDFSARDNQLAEMTSGFGPVKCKNFANSISSVVAEAGDVLPRIDALSVRVEINGATVAESTTAGMRYSIGEMVAYASRDEKVLPGELMGTGTVPGCCALENGHWLRPGDTIALHVDGVGSLTNRAGTT